MRNILPEMLVLLTVSRGAWGATLLVPEEYPTIQAAVVAAAPGDEVSVAPGRYVEHVAFKCHDVTLKSRVTRAATIDGGGSGHVVVCNPYRATVDGFVITGSGASYYAGVFTSQASQVIRNNIVTGNGGSGIIISSGSIATIEKNIIRQNSSSFFRAGVKCMTGASGTIIGNYFAQQAVGIWSDGNSVPLQIINNTIVDHGYYGLYFGDASAVLKNNIVANDRYGIMFTAGYAPDRTAYVAQHLQISYNVFWQNSSADYWAELVTYSTQNEPSGAGNVGPFTPLPGTGELHVDPGLIAGDWHLAAGSQSINAGDPGYVPEPGSTDLDGQPRVLYGRIDIGADEFAWAGDLDFDADVDQEDLAQFEFCTAGPGVALPVPGCLDADRDRDGDVDQTDFGLLQRCFSGPDTLPDPACAD